MEANVHRYTQIGDKTEIEIQVNDKLRILHLKYIFQRDYQKKYL